MNATGPAGRTTAGSKLAQHAGGDEQAIGTRVEPVPRTPLDVPLHGPYARAASAMVDALGRAPMGAACSALRPG